MVFIAGAVEMHWFPRFVAPIVLVGLVMYLVMYPHSYPGLVTGGAADVLGADLSPKTPVVLRLNNTLGP